MKTMFNLSLIRSWIAIFLFTGCFSTWGQESSTFKVSEFTFKVPPKWKKEKPASSMRAAQLSAPGKAESESAEVTFFFFGPQSGSVNANVDRWIRQFQNPTNTKRSSMEVKGTKVTYVRTDGTFMSGPPFGKKVARKDYSLLAAILEGKAGNVFVKLTGPRDTAVDATKAFKAMVEQAAAK